MLKLYQLPEAYEALYSRLAESDGELTPNDLAELHQLDTNLEQKAANICSLIRQAEAESDMIRNELERLSQLGIKREKIADRLKKYLMATMDQLGIQKIATGRPGLSPRIQRNSRPAIAVKEGQTVPLSYQRVIVELDGTKAYEDWKEGKQLPPSLVVTTGQHLRIG